MVASYPAFLCSFLVFAPIARIVTAMISSPWLHNEGLRGTDENESQNKSKHHLDRSEKNKVLLNAALQKVYMLVLLARHQAVT